LKRSNNIGTPPNGLSASQCTTKWSIAKNVGAMPTYLNKLITHPSYNKLARNFRIPAASAQGAIALKLAHKAEEGFKGAINEVGLRQIRFPDRFRRTRRVPAAPSSSRTWVRYLGLINGHDLPLLISTLDLQACDLRSSFTS